MKKSKIEQQKLTRVIFALFIVVSVITGITQVQNASAASLNQTMVKIGLTMESLFPILFSDNEPTEKQQKTLKNSVKKLSDLFKDVEPHIGLKSPTYRISFEVIETQLSQALSALKYKNFNYTKSILRDFTTICTTCHTQDSQLRTLFPNVKRDTFNSDFSYAEFNYMTRNYSTAIDYYNRLLKSGPQTKESELLSIMKRMITIYLQINYRPDDAIKQLNKLKAYQYHTKFSRRTLDEWLAGLKDLKRNKKSLPKIRSIDQLNVHVNKILGDLREPGSAQFPNKRERISRIWLRGELYHYLNANPSKEETPVILYWLSIVDRSINYSLYYSLADLYLKECMIKFDTHPYAKKCLEEYRAHVILSYSGSRGTDIPEDIQNELKALEIRVNPPSK